MMSRTMQCLAALLVLLALGIFAPRAMAASCSLNTGTPVAFGTYDPGSATPLDGQGAVVVECNGNGNNAWIAISLNAGLWGTFADRRMANGADRLSYNLYTDVNRTILFNNGTTVSCRAGDTSNPPCIGEDPQGGRLRATRPIFGRIPPGQNVGAGIYNDTVTITITF